MVNNTTALEEYLKPLEAILNDPKVSEISINIPHLVHIEKDGLIIDKYVDELTYYHLDGLTDLIARYTDQRLSKKEPLLSATLPDGHRIQIIKPPACESGTIALSIRKQVIKNLDLQDYVELGAFEKTQSFRLKHTPIQEAHDAQDKELQTLYKQKQYIEFLQQAIKRKKNIIVSGATSTGKTTFLNACLKMIPLDERIITLEDVREVQIPHINKLHLIASKGGQGTAKVSMHELIEASLRLRPDRIIMGELRGAEAADFCNATATGHDGSVASLHATNPQIAFMRLVHMIKLNPHMNLSREDILEDLHALIDIVVQLKRIRVGDRYQRYVSHIYYSAGSV